MSILVLADGKVVLTNESNGTWWLPGGRIGPAEGPITAAERELFEETGIKTTDLKTGIMQRIGDFQTGTMTCAIF